MVLYDGGGMSWFESILLWIAENNAAYWHGMMLISIWSLCACIVFLMIRVGRLEDRCNTLALDVWILKDQLSTHRCSASSDTGTERVLK